MRLLPLENNLCKSAVQMHAVDKQLFLSKTFEILRIVCMVAFSAYAAHYVYFSINI